MSTTKIKKIISLLLVAGIMAMLALPTLADVAENSSDFTIVSGVLIKYNGAGGSVTIPNNVTRIGGYAFYNCSSLTSVNIPNNATSIGDDAFYNCSSLTSVNIPNSVTSIGDYAFWECSSLTNVNIPNSVTSIGDYAFWECSSLTSVNIPNSVTIIGEDAFSGCSSLNVLNADTENSDYSSIGGVLFNKNQTILITYPGGINAASYTIPNSVTSIDDYAFSGGWLLTSVIIPNSVISIGDNAFSDCSALNVLSADTENPNYSSIGGVLFNKNQTILIAYPIGIKADSYAIPNSVTSIGDNAFLDCFSLTIVTIPNSVTSIGQNAFNGCSSFTSVTIPYSVTSIGNWAFAICFSLTNVIIPSSVTDIGQHAFSGCPSLTNVTIPSSVTSIGDNAFWECSSSIVVNVINGTYAQTYAQKYGLTFVVSPAPYTVNFNSNGGSTVASEPESINAVINAPTTPTYTGYTLSGWYDAMGGGNKINFPYAVNSDETFYAQWTPNTYNIKFNSNGGSAVSSKIAVYNTAITAPTTPTRAGYTLSGWYSVASGGTKATFPYIVTGNATFYAQWTSLTSLTPSGAKVSKISSTSTKYSWNAVSGASGYIIYRSTSTNGTFNVLSTVSSTSITNNGLSKGKTYYYKVAAYNVVNGKKVYSKNSAVVSIKM